MPESGRWGLHPYQTESSAFPLLLELGWLAYVRAGYRDSTDNESHFTFLHLHIGIQPWSLLEDQGNYDHQS